MNQLSPNAQKVQTTLQSMGYAIQVVELPASTRTAREAAQAIGCKIDQIVKSLIFKTKHTNKAILVLVSGVNRADEKKIEALIGEPLGKADPEFVKQETGFPIGGISPIGLKHPLPTFIDQDLLTHETVWAAAGTSHAVFEISPSELPILTSGKVCEIKKHP